MVLPESINQNEIEKAEKCKIFKKQLLETYPKERNADLNLERAEGFIKGYGLEVGDYIIVNDEELDVIWKQGISMGVLAEEDRSNWNGSYFLGLDLVMVRRDPKMERLNGKIFTEGILVHELAHESAKIFINPGKSYVYTRMGFRCSYGGGWGGFLEEGFAELFRGNYKEKYLTKEQKRKLSSSIRNLSARGNDEKQQNKEEMAEVISSVLKYFDLVTENRAEINKTSLASSAIELLMLVDRRLFSILVEARTSIEGFKKLAIRLNRIKPNLYVYLQKGDLSEKSFMEKYLFVRNKASGIWGQSVKANVLIMTFLEKMGII